MSLEVGRGDVEHPAKARRIQYDCKIADKQKFYSVGLYSTKANKSLGCDVYDYCALLFCECWRWLPHPCHCSREGGGNYHISMFC